MALALLGLLMAFLPATVRAYEPSIRLRVRLPSCQRSHARHPYQGWRFPPYLEIDVSGLTVVQGRPGVFVGPNEEPLDLVGRIVSWGKK